MDLLNELEAMAYNAVSISDSDFAIPAQTVSRWQSLFGYSAEEAIAHVEQHRADLTRPRVSDQHWALVHEAKEAEGHDRESYEYSMSMNPVKAKQRNETRPTDSRNLCLLEGPLESAEKVRIAAGLPTLPKVHKGLDDDGKPLDFVVLDAQETIRLVSAFEGQVFQPKLTCIPSPADKELSPTSPYPLLGIDTTLPQYRPQGTDLVYPAQNQYPVVYFFYGTLGESDRLMRLLGLRTAPKLEPATVAGARIKSWAGTYKALVDGPPATCVQGVAYEVASEEHEDSLRGYETSKYEVVRCDIHVERKGVVRGLTFRFRYPEEAV